MSPKTKTPIVKRTFYIDLDGVLADYNKRANEVCGMDQYKFEYVYGTAAYWAQINRDPDFFWKLEPMHDAVDLMDAVGGFTVLTGLPATNQEHIAEQKRAWCREQLGISVPVVTCLIHDKERYCSPGAVLIDDRFIYHNGWVNKGGLFYLHTDAKTTIRNMQYDGVL